MRLRRDKNHLTDFSEMLGYDFAQGGMWAASRNWCRFPVDVWITLQSKCKLFEKMIAHRVCPNFSISGINLHRSTVIYFSTDLKNIHPLESAVILKLGNICFREQLRVQFDAIRAPSGLLYWIR